MTNKEMIVRLVEAIEDEDELEQVKQLVQEYVARILNRRYIEERKEQ